MRADNLKSKFIHGIKWTSLSSLFIASAQIIQLAFLSRFVSATDFGLIAISNVAVGFCYIIVDLGIGSAIIHSEGLNKKKLSSLYWFSLFLGVLLTILLYLLSDFISDIYHTEQLSLVLKYLSITFTLSSFGSIFKFLVQKEMKFGIMAQIEVISISISVFLGCLSAYYGFGVFSLVISSLANVFISSSVYLVYGIKKQLVGFHVSLKDIRDELKFGMYVFGERVINYFMSQMDVILIGRLLGTEAVGVYSVIKQIAAKPFIILSPILNRVNFPLLSKLQNNEKTLSETFLNTLFIVAYVMLAIYGLMLVLSKMLITLILGSSWVEYTTFFCIFVIGYSIVSYVNPVGTLIIAKGKARLAFIWNIVTSLLLLVFLWIGSIKGIYGVAISVLIYRVALFIPGWYFVLRNLIDVSLTKYLTLFFKPAFCMFLSVACVEVIGLDEKLNINIPFYPVVTVLITVIIFLLFFFTLSLILDRKLRKHLLLIKK